MAAGQDWSDDDEGIGSDVSLEHSDQSSAGGTLEPRQTGRTAPQRNISLKIHKRFGRMLRRSVGGEAELTVTPEPGLATAEFQQQKVFGVELAEHLEQTAALVPRLAEFCCEVIEQSGVTDGIYRLSGQRSHILALRRQFEGGKVPDRERASDVHAVASLLKLYFRSLPSPLLTFPLYSDFIRAGQLGPRYQLAGLRRVVGRLPGPHLTTLQHLTRHLHRLSQHHSATGMTPRNLAIVWAPNLLRPPGRDSLTDCGVQALVIESLIVYYEEIFEATASPDATISRKNFTKEVSIDQAVAVARAESFKPKIERRMVRSISCVSATGERANTAMFQARGVQLRRDRSLTAEHRSPASRGPPRPAAPASKPPNLYTSTSVTVGPFCSQHAEMNRSKGNNDDVDGDVASIEEAENKNIKIRSSRARLKERLNWFSSRSRQRLSMSSFGSSDNLQRYVKDRLNCALSPVRGRAGSYTVLTSSHTVLTSSQPVITSEGSIRIRVNQ